MRPWEELEYHSEYDWNRARQVPRRRSGVLALVFLGLAVGGFIYFFSR